MEKKELSEPKNLGQESFVKTQTSNIKRNIARETFTVQSTNSKLKTKLEDRQKSNISDVQKPPSLFLPTSKPSLKRGIYEVKKLLI